MNKNKTTGTCSGKKGVKVAYFSFGDRRAKEFKVLKCLVNIFVLLLIEKCVVQSMLVEANLSHLVAARLNYSSDTISCLNFKNKIKVAIE